MSEVKYASPDSKAQIVSVLMEVWRELLGVPDASIDINRTFLELGADSLRLLHASQLIKTKTGVKVPFRLMLEECSTVDALANYICEQLPQEQAVSRAQVSLETGAIAFESRLLESEPALSSETERNRASDEAKALHTMPLSPLSGIAPEPKNGNMGMGHDRSLPAGGLEKVIAMQLQLMSRQLDLLHRRQVPVAAASSAKSAQTSMPAVAGSPVIRPSEHKSGRQKIEPQVFIPHQQLKAGSTRGLNPTQQKYLDRLIADVTRRTQGSKKAAESARSILANNRGAAGFHLLWKEMQYPLALDRASGSRVWDVDGNEYVDLTMGFGALLFGHSPEFICEAVRGQIDQGLRLGGETVYARRAAELLRELTGVERATFVNSGTEAVMTALRLARCVTGRSKIAIFEGSYHGTFDGVLVIGQRQDGGRLKAIPLAPGVPQSLVQDVVLLNMKDPGYMDALEEHAGELAAVLVEPRQSRRPDLDTSDFLRSLREFTNRSGAALIFDEVVTGFRFHQGGGQALFGVQADLVTYGKAMGGGLPVAAVAGKSLFMDAIDGGMWSYGDSSYPAAETTYVAGTYFMHPLIMPAVCASLTHIKNSGPTLQERLNQMTSRLVNALDKCFEEEQAPIRIGHFGSIFRFFFSKELLHTDLFFYSLLKKGVFICETRTCILSTAHTDEDLEFVIRAVKETVAEMRAGGFLPGLPGGAEPQSDPPADLLNANGLPAALPGAKAAPLGARKLPMTEAQKGIWALSQMGDDASRAYNQSVRINIRGPFDLQAMREAVRQVVNRHEALRSTFSADGDHQLIHSSCEIDVKVEDLSRLDGQQRDLKAAGWLAQEAEQNFDLARGPLVRATVLKLGDQLHTLILTIHHIVTDGWSNAIVQRELGVIYEAQCRGTSPHLDQPMQFSEYVQMQLNADHEKQAESEAYWVNRFADGVPVLDLPTDYPRPPQKTYASSRKVVNIEEALFSSVKSFSSQNGCTLVMTFLAAYSLLLREVSRQNDFVIGLHLAGQLAAGCGGLVGHCVNLAPLRIRIGDRLTFVEHLAEIKGLVLESYKHQRYSLNHLIKKLALSRDPSRLPLVTVTFNIDVSPSAVADSPNALPAASPDGRTAESKPVKADVAVNPSGRIQWDLSLNINDSGGAGLALFDYNQDLFSAQTIGHWGRYFDLILREIVVNPQIRLDDLSRSLAAAGAQYLAEKKRTLKENFATARRKAIHP